jgi:hypothetical protein
MGDESSGDCSDRICPYEYAFVDKPDVSGTFHKYMECSGKGICDRVTGECDCFEGYTGKGCQRQTCPNDCSGHGTCEYIEDLTYGVVPGQYWGFFAAHGGIHKTAKTFDNTISKIWDYHKSMACVCDPRYIDVDCSRRMCPKSNDVMDERMNTEDTQLYQTQKIIMFDSGNTEYHNISMMDWSYANCTGSTNGDCYDSTGARIPGLSNANELDNKGKDDFGAHKFIHGIYNTTTAGDYDWFEKEGENFALTFTSTLNESFTTYPIFVHDHPDMFGKQVELALKSLPNRVITDVSVTAKMGWLKFNHTADGMLSVFESRGKEDNAQIGEPVYTENLDLFSALNIPTEWKDDVLANVQFHYIELLVEFNGVPKGPQNLLTVETKECKDGCTPKLNGIHLIPFGPGNGGFVVEDTKADYNNYECGRRGKCDYETGECECFEGYTGEACSTQTALV